MGIDKTCAGAGKNLTIASRMLSAEHCAAECDENAGDSSFVCEGFVSATWRPGSGSDEYGGTGVCHLFENCDEGAVRHLACHSPVALPILLFWRLPSPRCLLATSARSFTGAHVNSFETDHSSLLVTLTRECCFRRMRGRTAARQMLSSNSQDG